jgi:hypothetical protein
MPHSIGRPVSSVAIITLGALLWAGSAAWGQPAGSYQATCKNDVLSNTMSAIQPGVPLQVLTADCKNTSGKWVATRLVGTNQCIGDIANIDGSLRCSKAPLPEGNYQQSCRYAFVDVVTDSAGKIADKTLRAECKARNGTWAQTSLPNVQNCTTQVSNYNGVLRCSMGSVPSTGTYAASCQDIFADRTTLNASCKNFAGQWVQASLPNFTQCAPETVANIDGFLTCIPEGQVAPGGTYLLTCRNVMPPHTFSATGQPDQDLEALCREPNGSWDFTTLSLTPCQKPFNVTNVYGGLSCVQGSAQAPAGSYLQTCRDIVSNPGSLKATCRTESGAFVPSPALTGCTHSVWNDNGTLRCSS